jgi:MerR family transcriptional regulator, redox-sensitive transcriptional activator SoxR
VARRAGVATSSIRYYERIGLLPRPERLHGQRRYDPEVLGKLGFIGVPDGAGFKLAEIRELMDGVDSSAGMGSADADALEPEARRGGGASVADQGDEGLARGCEGVRMCEPD